MRIVLCIVVVRREGSRGLEELLVVGWDLTTSSVVHVDHFVPEVLRCKGHGSDCTLICLYCYQGGEAEPGTHVPLVVKGKVRGRRRYHFAHPPHMAPAGGHGGETRWHVDGKLAVESWALRQPNVASAQAEWQTTDRVRRADVMICLTDGCKLALELQYRPLTDTEWTRHHQDYADRGIHAVWLWRPGLYRPGILLQGQLPVWWFDVEQQHLSGLVGRPHQRPPDWHHQPSLALYARHWPPCPDDHLTTYTYRLQDTAIGPAGPLPDLEVAEQLAEVQFEAEYLRAEEIADLLGLPEQGEDSVEQALSDRQAAQAAEQQRLGLEAAYERLRLDVGEKNRAWRHSRR